MKTCMSFSLVACLATSLVCGCASVTENPNARYIQTGGAESIVSVGQINIQDFMYAGTSVVNKLLASGVLDSVSNPPALLAMSRVINNTGQQVDTDLLTKKIRVALLESGKAITTTTLGVGGLPEDPLAKGLKQEADFMADAKTTRTPDFTLSGKIIETSARAGNLRQSTFTFQLSLTAAKNGEAVWEGEESITKQATRPNVAF